jgi:pterin-4a-carbinolamine dehydratase
VSRIAILKIMEGTIVSVPPHRATKQTLNLPQSPKASSAPGVGRRQTGLSSSTQSVMGPATATHGRGDDAHRIERTLRFRNFREALAFVQQVGELAETEGHHPDISFGWGHATVSLRFCRDFRHVDVGQGGAQGIG